MAASDEHTRFYKFLDQFPPNLTHFWDRDKDEANLEQIDRVMGKLSRGERTILNILVTIWLGNAQGRYEVDISDITALSDETREPILQWLQEPFWP